jgi:hypothetical protein
MSHPRLDISKVTWQGPRVNVDNIREHRTMGDKPIDSRRHVEMPNNSRLKYLARRPKILMEVVTSRCAGKGSLVSKRGV